MHQKHASPIMVFNILSPGKILHLVQLISG